MGESTKANRWDKSLAKLDVPEVRYKADLELHDRAQTFSSELAKLALAGIAVVGFLLGNFPEARMIPLLDDWGVVILFSASVIGFALAAACGLLQRFVAGGALFHHLQVIKLSMLTGDDGDKDKKIAEDMETRKRKFMIAHRLLQCSAALLVASAALLSAAFVRMLFIRQ